MAAALATTVALVVTTDAASGEAGAPDLAQRLFYLAGAITIPLLWLAAAIGSVARLRFVSPDDIGAGGGVAAGDHVRAAGAVAQNTLEQAVLAGGAIVAMALTAPDPRLPLLGLAASFSIGRALFWVGYRGGARGRAFGFALTFYPSVAYLLLAASRVTIASLR